MVVARARQTGSPSADRHTVTDVCCCNRRHAGLRVFLGRDGRPRETLTTPGWSSGCDRLVKGELTRRMTAVASQARPAAGGNRHALVDRRRLHHVWPARRRVGGARPEPEFRRAASSTPTWSRPTRPPEATRPASAWRCGGRSSRASPVRAEWEFRTGGGEDHVRFLPESSGVNGNILLELNFPHLWG